VQPIPAVKTARITASKITIANVLLIYLLHILKIQNLSSSEWHTKEGNRQNGVNDHRWQEYPPDIAMIFVEVLVGGVLHKPANQSVARDTPTGKEYQGNSNQIDNAQTEYQFGD
jgi:hypothetical protein